MFSRIRSNTTMVSLLEYPIRVKMAAITVRDISQFNSEKAPTVIKVSWKTVSTAATP